jgi:CubicO group peptidase (beta-lactamase class C family)
LSAVKDQKVDDILRRHVLDAGVAPAATAGFATAFGAQRVGAGGSLPEGPVGEQTLFDLASVSKPIVACALARLAARGVIELGAPLGALLPEARGTRSERVSLELLLAHRGGLEAHRSLFAPLFGGRPVVRADALGTAADARRSECAAEEPREFPPVYSDLGYLLVGAAIESVVGEPLDRVVEREVAEPLGLELGAARQLRRRRPSFARDVAPTEVVRARGGLVRGVVHDENAWALSGHGCSGHAGLFGSVSAVLGFGSAVLCALRGEGAWLDRASVETLVLPRRGGSLRAGFDGKSEGASSAGARSSSATFGHLGFTGTSLWCDPAAGTVSVLLTNRVHPSRENPRIRAARPVVHDALFEAAKALLPGAPDP